ncbi:hypothetical protein ONS95_006360 [Cadophora gregata]|uniref:uncharacterized protein n=1 Tax=Cadophora gregata TaxID=51156 RepID=UPI0026DD45E6|nr:uncharacterized protein ONS95_006360 [Cadophora gregata]KAK0099270.1 hypothetical protein ONS96_008504 [Cadophora gregata f. sp. sojae]KAK0102763.1 hypothetical protein ONS95_006360 [Cadophora gregata]
MPSETHQHDAKLDQPWKKWHEALNPMGIDAVRDGTLILSRNKRGSDSGSHGTTALKKKHVDLSAPKEVPSI